MTHQHTLDTLEIQMIEYYRGDPKRIQHFIKVHNFASLIGRHEHLCEHERFLLESIAFTHDIGIKPSEEKYGNCNGKNQEKEGVAPAKKMLSEIGYTQADTERITNIIAHHHTYENITDPLHQIILEADFLVNMFEDDLSKPAILSFKDKIFKTLLGKELCDAMIKE